MATQDNWRWCRQCQGMFFGGDRARGSCPNAGPFGGPHSFEGSGNYNLRYNETVPGFQPGWRWCHKCEGLFFAGNCCMGVCPAGGTHASEGSADYSLGSSGVQSNWRWCKKCQGMFFAGNSRGSCPAGGTHTLEGSGDYRLDYGPTVNPIRVSYLVTWQSFERPLQDDCDFIQVTRQPVSGDAQFVLEAAPNVDFSKEIKIISPGHDDRTAHTGGSQRRSETLYLPAGELGQATLVLSKGKFLNVLTGMYQVSSLLDTHGTRVTFTWQRDHC